MEKFISDTDLLSVFCVVFYTSYRKENEWKIHKIFIKKESALSYAMSISTKLDDDDDDYDSVVPHPFGQHIWLQNRLCEIKNEMSWTPLVAVVEQNVSDK